MEGNFAFTCTPLSLLAFPNILAAEDIQKHDSRSRDRNGIRRGRLQRYYFSMAAGGKSETGEKVPKKSRFWTSTHPCESRRAKKHPGPQGSNSPIDYHVFVELRRQKRIAPGSSSRPRG